MIAEMMMGDNMVRHYSTEGKYIKQVGGDCLFLTADNEIPCPFEYVETDETPQEPEDWDEVGRVLMGVTE